MDYDVEAVIHRLKNLYAVDSDGALATALGASKTAVTNWRKRGSVPLEQVMKACREHHSTLDYVYYGTIQGVYEAKGGYRVDANDLSTRAKALTETQRLAVANILKGLESLVEQFEQDNRDKAFFDNMKAQWEEHQAKK